MTVNIDPELRQLDKAIAFLEARQPDLAQGRINVVLHRLSHKMQPLDFTVTCGSCGSAVLFGDRASHACEGAR